MKAKPLPVGSRHPKVVMIVDNDEDTSGSSSILATHIEEYRTIQLNDETTEYLHQTEPAVILFALGTVEKCIEYYTFLVDESELRHIHYSIVLCNNKESSIAFRCCMKGLFDNYFVYQPLYEKLRILMVVKNGLNQTETNSQIKAESGELFEAIDQDLSELIEEGSRCKKTILDKIDKKRQELKAINESDELDSLEGLDEAKTNEVMATIKQDHITPLLAHLEDDIRASLDNMIAQLLNKKTAIETTSNKDSALQPAVKQKGLITHVPSIIKRNTPEEGVNSAPIKEEELFGDELFSDELFSDETQEVSASKILVVEDNNLYRDMIVSVLSKENYSVDEAEDGLCALKKIKDEHYDLILMDLFMPNLDGLNATKKIRQLSGGRDIPVIALTGNKNKEIVKKWAHYGLKGYIMKPSTKNEILNVVKQITHPETNAVKA